MSEFAELIVMLKAPGTKSDIEALAQIVNARIVEITRMFDAKLVGLLSVASSDAEASLKTLEADSRVELAELNRTYKHC